MDSIAGQSTRNRPFADRDVFRDVIRHFASGVTVITSRNEGTDLGITANAEASLTLDPQMLVACVSKQTDTGNAIRNSGAFAVNTLDENQGEIAMCVAKHDTDKFASMNISYGQLRQRGCWLARSPWSDP